MIPARTNRLHLKPYWLGDSPRAINVASRRSRYVDINFQVTKDGVVGLHWSTAAANGYRFMQVGARRRPMTWEELHRPINAWTTAGVLRWRRTLRTGLRYEKRVRPYTFRELVRHAKSRRVVICAELKSRLFATKPEIAKKMHSDVVSLGATVYPMTLVNMWGYGPKMRNFRKAGFETALLPHGHPKPKDLSLWMPYISRVWGRWGG